MEGKPDKSLLGGKGAGLAEMSQLGIPVPPGFTISTEVCRFYQQNEGKYPDSLAKEVEDNLARVEREHGKRFGEGKDPLLVSVRSGAPVSMPGMMDTILNLGLNDNIVAEAITAGAEPRFLRDCYRRLLSMYGDVVLKVPHSDFEKILEEARERQGVETDAELSQDSLLDVIAAYKAKIAEHGKPFPEDPKEQLWGAITAVFESWDNRRAREYRRLQGLSNEMGTAVNVQVMVFGNRGDDCATGVAFSRNPATGEKGIFGEYLINAQGEDVVAGIRTPQSISPDADSGGMTGQFAAAYETLKGVCRTLEKERRDMQDVEFTVDGGRLYMLQTRNGKRTGFAAVRIAVDMVDEGLIEPADAVARVEPEQLSQLLAPVFDLEQKQEAIAHGDRLAEGLPAGPGAASGKIALSAEHAAEMAANGNVILVRAETSPEDIVGMHAAAGILTARGGMTSHAAVVARGLGKPCVVGAGALRVDEAANEIRVDDRVLHEGDELSIDGSTGEVLAGSLTARESEVLQVLMEGREETPASTAFRRLLEWADDLRRLDVRTNADTPADAKVARAFGAEGIGLCRTEHMFFDEERIAWVRQAIVAANQAEREQALEHLLPMQQSDFEGIFEAMAGLPVTVRLLDPPLHEFLPKGERAIAELASQMGIEASHLADVVDRLAETNPMLGHRGCRLGLTAPDIYTMQVEAIARAAVNLSRRGVDVRPEIMVPLVGSTNEMMRLRSMIESTLERVLSEEDSKLEIPIGTMIEVPRAALVADKIAAYADFFSFGTNDLTQMTFGFSRDDVGSFLPRYIEDGIVPGDPFASIDIDGVGQLVRLAVARGRESRSGIKLGVCGEHGGDPRSVEFFHGVGLDYVSCSPYRVPIARLAAARANQS